MNEHKTFCGNGKNRVAQKLYEMSENWYQNWRRERHLAGIAKAKKLGKYKGRRGGVKAKDMVAAFYLRVSGLKLREIADTMGIGLRTVVKYLRCAKDAAIEAIEKGKKTARR